MTENIEELAGADQSPLTHDQPGDWLFVGLLGLGIVAGSAPVGVAAILLDTLLSHH